MARSLALALTILSQILCLSANAAPQLIEGLVNIRFQTDVRIFAVMAAANAAGFDLDAEDLHLNPVRKMVRERLANLDPELRSRLADFLRAPGAPVESQLVSYALLLGGPPAFSLTMKAQEIPEDVRHLAGFESVLRQVWQQAGLDRLWNEVRPMYAKDIEAYRPLLREMIVRVLGYFRTEARVALDRQVIFIPDLLNAFGMVNARNIGNDYLVMVGPSRAKEKPMRGLRHEYLHFLLDPMMNKYRGYLPEPGPFLKRIQEQAKVRNEFAADFGLAAAESLVRAAELRLDALPREELETALARGYEQGLILMPYFEENLEKFEIAQQSVQEWFPGLIENMSWDMEQRRPGATAQLRSRPGKTAGQMETQPRPALSPELRDALTKANQFLQQRDFESAKSHLETALRMDPTNPNALFGLAQIAAQEETFDEALALYEKAAAHAGGDLWIAGWSFVHRGNIYMELGDRDRAREEWTRVLKLQGDLRGAAEAAQKALAQSKLQV
jgi:tetratricopeptide (TPR) repeat protein